MKPTKPPGANAPCSRLRYQCATLKTMTSNNTLFINNDKVTFVIEMSHGRTCSPASLYSTIFPSYLLPEGAMEKPSYVPPFSSSREERKVCQPLFELYTITGNGIVICVLPQVVICLI